MAKITDVNQIMQGILQSLATRIGGVLSVFIVDLKKDRLMATYPQEESKAYEFYSLICGNSVHILENQAREDFERTILVTEMELQTSDGEQIYLSRIAQDLILCIVGDSTFKPGYAERLCTGKGLTKQLILETLERYQIPFVPA